jgi:hypothetical protein
MVHQTAAKASQSSASALPSGQTADSAFNGTTGQLNLASGTQGDGMAKVEPTRRFTMLG